MSGKRRRGQSTLEYVIILSAVVMAVIVGINSFFGKKDATGGLGKLMTQAGQRIEDESGKIASLVK